MKSHRFLEKKPYIFTLIHVTSVLTKIFRILKEKSIFCLTGPYIVDLIRNLQYNPLQRVFARDETCRRICMTRRELTDFCLGYTGAYDDHPFDDGLTSNSWTALRHRGNTKCFAFIHERGGLSINLKCEPMRGDFLRQEFPAITPAYHMNKRHWITVPVD